MVTNNPLYKEMEEDAYDMVAGYANAEELIGVKEFYRKDGKIDMCEALTALIEEGREEGREEGIRAFILLCESFGVARENTLQKLKENFNITDEKAEEEVDKYWK